MSEDAGDVLLLLVLGVCYVLIVELGQQRIIASDGSPLIALVQASADHFVNTVLL